MVDGIMKDGRVNSSSVFKLLLVLFVTLFAGQSRLSLLQNGKSATHKCGNIWHDTTIYQGLFDDFKYTLTP